MLYERDGFQFELNSDGTATLVKYRGGDAIPSVPGEADGHTVTAIGSWAFGKFLGKRPILGVRLPDSLTGIGEYAFSNCKKLSDLVIPKGVASIGAAAFSGCASLLRVILPQVTEINDWLFKDCRSLREIKIPAGVKYIGKGAFFGCRSLAEIFLPDDVASVEFETFRDCRSLSLFDLPPAVTRINDGAFKDCHSLAHLTVSERVTFIGWQDVFPPGLIIHAVPGSYAEAYAKAKRLPLIRLEVSEENGASPDGEQPDGTQSQVIAERAFAGSLEITQAVIPEGTVNIGNGAYSGCALLSRAELPESLLTIGIDAFAGTALEEITVPQSVVKIGWNAFPQGAVLRGEKGSCAEAYARKYNYAFEVVRVENAAENKSMKEVLQAVLEIAGREAFADARLFKNLLSDLLPDKSYSVRNNVDTFNGGESASGGGKNAGVRNILYAAVSQLKVLSAVEQNDAAAPNRFAASLIDLGYQPRLSREAAVSFWAVLCYSQKSDGTNEK